MAHQYIETVALLLANPPPPRTSPYPLLGAMTLFKMQSNVSRQIIYEAAIAAIK